MVVSLPYNLTAGYVLKLLQSRLLKSFHSFCCLYDKYVTNKLGLLPASDLCDAWQLALKRLLFRITSVDEANNAYAVYDFTYEETYPTDLLHKSFNVAVDLLEGLVRCIFIPLKFDAVSAWSCICSYTATLYIVSDRKTCNMILENCDELVSSFLPSPLPSESRMAYINYVAECIADNVVLYTTCLNLPPSTSVYRQSRELARANQSSTASLPNNCCRPDIYIMRKPFCYTNSFPLSVLKNPETLNGFLAQNTAFYALKNAESIDVVSEYWYTESANTDKYIKAKREEQQRNKQLQQEKFDEEKKIEEKIEAQRRQEENDKSAACKERTLLQREEKLSQILMEEVKQEKFEKEISRISRDLMKPLALTEEQQIHAEVRPGSKGGKKKK